MTYSQYILYVNSDSKINMEHKFETNKHKKKGDYLKNIMIVVLAVLPILAAVEIATAANSWLEWAKAELAANPILVEDIYIHANAPAAVDQNLEQVTVL